MLISCSDENESVNEKNNVEFTMKTLAYAPIGVKENGNFKLIATSENILKAAKAGISSDDSKFEPISHKIFEQNDKRFLRVYGKNNEVSTIEIGFNPKTGNFRTLGTLCKTTDCANGGGCVPDGLYCTPCIKNPGAEIPLEGDCSRETTSEPVDPGFDPGS